MNLCAGGFVGGREGCGVITGKKTERGERRKCDRGMNQRRKKNIGGFGALVVVDVSRRLHDPMPRTPHSFSVKMKT